MNTHTGYAKLALTDTSVLLAAGGSKPLSDFRLTNNTVPSDMVGWEMYNNSVSGGITLADAILDDFRGNKIAFLDPSCITVQYSTNGGTSWSDYELTDSLKVSLTTTPGGTAIYLGKVATAGTITPSNVANYKSRIYINTRNASGTAKMYTYLKHVLINISTNGASGCTVKIDRLTIGDYNNRGSGTRYNTNESAWTNIGTYEISGWSGWNSIYISSIFGGGTSQTSNDAALRFTFSATGANTSYPSNCTVIGMRFIGITNWTPASTMASTGHLYTYDTSLNATFPANITATSFIGTASSVSRATFGDKDNGSHDANAIKSNGLWYYSSNGPTTTLGATTSDGALYSQAYNTSWAGLIALDYRNGKLFVRGLNNGTWTNWLKVAMYNEVLPLTGGTVTGDFTLYNSSNGSTPFLNFRRATYTDTYDDWRMFANGSGFFILRTSGSTTNWVNRLMLAPNVSSGTNAAYLYSDDGTSDRIVTKSMVVTSSDNGVTPKVINTNTATVTNAYYVLASSTGLNTPSWYKLPSTAFSSGLTYSVASTSDLGLSPKLALAATSGDGANKQAINSQANDYVLTYTSGTETTPKWRKLPSTAFSSGLTYSLVTGSANGLVHAPTSSLSASTDITSSYYVYATNAIGTAPKWYKTGNQIHVVTTLPSSPVTGDVYFITSNA